MSGLAGHTLVILHVLILNSSVLEGDLAGLPVVVRAEFLVDGLVLGDEGVVALQ